MKGASAAGAALVLALPLLTVALPLALLGGLAVGLVAWVAEEAPYPPARLEAYYRQAQAETGVPWAAIAGLDGAANEFSLPVESLGDVFACLYAAALAEKRAAWEEYCRENTDPETGLPPSPYCDEPPDLSEAELQRITRWAYILYWRGVRDHVFASAWRLQERVEWLAINPERAYAGLVPPDRVALANDLFEGYTLHEYTLADDIDHGDVPVSPDPPPGFTPVAGFDWPVDGPISSRFGPRWGRPHAGIDLAVDAGTPVRAARAGTVAFAGFEADGYGHYVIIDHGDGYATVYAHNARLSVARGDRVEQGDVIALAGSSGRSTGPHLHFEIRYRGVAYDPLLFLGHL